MLYRRDESWRRKLQALLQGLDCGDIDDLMQNLKSNDYFRMGSNLRLRHKLLQIHWDETKDVVKHTEISMRGCSSEPYFNIWSMDKKKSDG